MEINWIKDFLALAETKSFSRAAEIRNITQSAFSRRIQRLESSLGVSVVDRTTYPTHLTKQGELFFRKALDLLEHFEETQRALRDDVLCRSGTIEIALPHTLLFSFFPRWLSSVEAALGHCFSINLDALNVHDAVLRLIDGTCDLAIVYHHLQQPVRLDLNHFDMICLGGESVFPYSKKTSQGLPLYNFNNMSKNPVPVLQYSSNAYLHRISNLLLTNLSFQPKIEKRFETDMAEGLKMMAIEGHGIAFLPESTARRDVESGHLVCVDPKCVAVLEIRAYRARKLERYNRQNIEQLDELWSWASLKSKV